MKIKNIFILSISFIIVGCDDSTIQIPNENNSGVGYYQTDVTIEGLPYRCGSYSGTTKEGGKFDFEINKTCQFFIDRALIREFKAPTIDPVNATETNQTILQFLYTLDSDGNRSNGIYINPTTLKTIQQGKLTRMPLNDQEINRVVEFLKENDTTYNGRFVSQEELKTEHLENTLSSMYILYFDNKLKEIYLDTTFDELNIKSTYGYLILQTIKFQLIDKQLLLNSEPFKVNSINNIEGVKDQIKEIENQEILYLEELWSYESVTSDVKSQQLQEIETLYGNMIKDLEETLSIDEESNQKLFILETLHPKYVIFKDGNTTLGFFSDYETVNSYLNNPNTFELSNENNTSLIFTQSPPMDMIPVDDGDIETPSFDMEMPVNDWEVPNPEDITTFDGIRG